MDGHRDSGMTPQRRLYAAQAQASAGENAVITLALRLRPRFCAGSGAERAYTHLSKD
jgi:hypothetical protein